jgi:Tol biopolymer transport system component
MLTLGSLTASQSENHATGWMSDDTVLLVSNRTGKSQIHRQRLGQDSAQPLVAGPDEQDGAERSPDGQWILYWSTASDRESNANHPEANAVFFFRRINTTGPRIAAGRCFGFPLSRGFRRVLRLQSLGEERNVFCALDPLRGRGKEIARTSVEWSTLLHWSLSRDGSHIAISSLDRLPEQIRIVNLKSHTERNLPVPHGWRIILTNWAADGNSVFAEVAGAQAFLAHIDLSGKAQVLLDRGRSQWLNTPCASADGRRLAFSRQIIDSNVWLMENF